ncbi:hypothetical protein T439DRAFT_353987 [Meredithblackwellia eburnea MCA 4105]
MPHRALPDLTSLSDAEREEDPLFIAFHPANPVKKAWRKLKKQEDNPAEVSVETSASRGNEGIWRDVPWFEDEWEFCPDKFVKDPEPEAFETSLVSYPCRSKKDTSHCAIFKSFGVNKVDVSMFKTEALAYKCAEEHEIADLWFPKVFAISPVSIGREPAVYDVHFPAFKLNVKWQEHKIFLIVEDLKQCLNLGEDFQDHREEGAAARRLRKEVFSEPFPDYAKIMQDMLEQLVELHNIGIFPRNLHFCRIRLVGDKWILVDHSWAAVKGKGNKETSVTSLEFDHGQSLHFPPEYLDLKKFQFQQDYWYRSGLSIIAKKDYADWEKRQGAVDIWFFGQAVYELLGGSLSKLPLPSYVEARQNHITQLESKLTQTGVKDAKLYCDAIRKCFNVDFEKRPQARDLLKHLFPERYDHLKHRA